MGRVNFDTDSYTYQQDQRKLSRYRNPYKHPDTLAVADAHFDGATSYTEQYIPTRVSFFKGLFKSFLSNDPCQASTPDPVRHPWTTSNVIAGGHRDDHLERTTTNE